MPHQCTGCGHVFEDGSKEMLSGCPDCGGNTFQFRPAGGTESSERTDQTSGKSADTPMPPDHETGSVAETVGRATTKMRDLVSSSSSPPSSPPSPSGTNETPAPESEPATNPDPEADWPDDAPRSASDSPNSNPSSSGGDTSEVAPGDADEIPTEDGEIIDADARREKSSTGEDIAQASARSDVVSPSELDGRPVDPDIGAGVPSSRDLSPEEQPPENSPEDGEIVSEPTDEDPDLTELREQLNDQFESIKIVEPGQYELNLMELYDRDEYIIALQENGRYVIQVPEQWMGEDPDDR